MLLKAKPWGSPTIELFTSVCELSIVDMSKGVVNLNWWILSLPNAVKNTFEPSGLKSISEGFDTRPAKEIDCLKVGLTSAKEWRLKNK